MGLVEGLLVEIACLLPLFEPVEIPFGSHRGTDVYTTTHCNKRVVNHNVQPCPYRIVPHGWSKCSVPTLS